VRKLLTCFIVLALIASSLPIVAGATQTPYEAYTYNYYGDAVPLPAPFAPERQVSGQELGAGAFRDPADVFVTEDGTVYILDSGNNRLLRTDGDWRAADSIATFTNEGREDTLRNPQGLFVSDEHTIYIADTDNNRIVVLSPEGELLRIVASPESEVLPQGFVFTPVKLTVDDAGRMFVVARGVYEGLMQFDENGGFIGYAGTINVRQTFADRIWRMLATREQRSRMQLFIPTEFSNVDIDTRGFVFATNIDTYSQTPIRRLNPSGQDVLKRFGYHPVMGDVRYRQFGNNSGPSRMTDIKVLGGGIYVAMDSYRGRLFAYNDEGQLLYAFGGKGTQLGLFNTPVAVERLGERLLVLDRGKNALVVFAPTHFGRTVHEATTQRYLGNDAEAVAQWEEVLRINANYDLAYLGIGKSLLMERKNKEAMTYFKLGMDRKYYSLAFKRHRREVMQAHFGTFMTTVALLIVALVGWLIFRKVRARGKAHEAGAL